MTTSADARQAFIDEFRAREAELVGAHSWVAELRARGIETFADLGFPTAKSEDWKYTSVGPLLRRSFARVPDASAADEARLGEQLARLPGRADGDLVAVFVNGRLSKSLSRLSETGAGSGRDGGGGLELDGLADRLRSDGAALTEHLGRYADPGAQGFVALNAALFSDGALLRVRGATRGERTVHLVFCATAAADPFVAHVRNLIIAEKGASARVVEHWIGEPGASQLTNAVTEIAMDAGSTLDHVKVQHESEAAHHVHRVEVRQQQSSTFCSHAIALGAALSRTEIATTLAGEGAECALYGLYFADGRRHVDHHTTIDHAVARTTSRELYKGILDGQARGVFTGKVTVRPDAQQISAEQTNRNLLLSEGAMVETRPQLEIYADDVKCTHGAAIGRLDEDALFYMRQRGIALSQARALLTYAFGSEVLRNLTSEGLRRTLERELLERLRAHGRGDWVGDVEGVVA